MTDVVNCQVRQERGKRRNRRLRAAGSVPAILYGHGEKNISLQVPADEIASAIRHGSKVVELKGGVHESALIREVHWDIYGAKVLHLDFTRVSATERVHTSVRVDLRGEAPGTRMGGVVEHLLHEVEIECPAMSVPDHLELKLNSLELGKSLHVSDIPLPQGVAILGDPHAVVVHCITPAAEEEEAAAGAGAEPELIRRKPEGEEEAGA